MKKFALLSVILVLCLNMTSCINIVRNIKVNNDGSGSENLVLDFDKTFFDIMVSFGSMSDSSKAGEIRDSLYNDEDFVSGIKSKLSTIPGVTVNELYSTTNPDSSKTIYADYNFTNIDVLGISMSDDSGQMMGSNIKVEYIDEGDQIRFSYIELPSLKEESGNGNDTAYNNLIDGIADMFAGKETVMNIEFAYDVISSNATYTEGRKLTWVIPMDEKIRNKSKIQLEAVLRK